LQPPFASRSHPVNPDLDAADDDASSDAWEDDAARDDLQGSEGEGLSKPTAKVKLAAGLHIVATPIGAAADITLRALQTLTSADVVACEDTRVTQRLLTIHGIRTPLLPYHEHNAERMRPQLLARMAAGQAVALASDAGTPLISDPGFKLVRETAATGLAVASLPGACAAIVALTLSGLPSDRFLFAGFLPSRQGARRGELAELAGLRATLIFYESARRLPESLADMAFVLGEREAAVARELTKLYEEVRRGRLADVAAHYMQAGPPKGEVVVVVGPPDAGSGAASEADIDRLLLDALSRLSVRDAAAETAMLTGLPKKQIYARALALAEGLKKERR
jgi:16S rRNA (cytidine1402-2'-O)-methyltransferase